MDYNSNYGSPGSFDLMGLARQVIYEVDSIRSFNDGESTNGQADGGYNESRVNAFLRLIGLPMFVNVKPEKTSGTILNTGYGSYLTSEIENMEVLPDFAGLKNLKNSLAQREINYITEESRVDEEKSEAMSSSLEKMIPLVPNFPENMEGKPGSKFSRKVFKMLFPLIPSYKKINPSNRNVARPFSNNLEIYKGESLRKPFLETVILIRLVFGKSGNSEEANKNKENLLDSLKEETTEAGYAKINKLVSSLQGSGGSEFIIIKIFDSLSQLAERFSELKSQQESLKRLGGKFTVSLQTESSKNTFGKKISSVTSSSFDDSSAIGATTIKLRQKLAEEQAYLLLLTGDSSFNAFSDNTKNASDSLMSSLFIDLLKKKVKDAESKVKSQEEYFKIASVEADKLRVEVDLMTGEFCGLSMVDVIAVIAGLFSISEEHLIALLDKETKDSMVGKPVFNKIETLLKDSKNDVGRASEAIIALQNSVEFFYGYINHCINSVNDRTKRNVTVPKKQKQ